MKDGQLAYRLKTPWRDGTTLAQAHGDPGFDFDQSSAEDQVSNEDT